MSDSEDSDPFGDLSELARLPGAPVCREPVGARASSAGNAGAASQGQRVTSSLRVELTIKGTHGHADTNLIVTVTIPPDGTFGLENIRADSGWPRTKVKRYGWIHAHRVNDLLNGLWERDGRKFFRIRRTQQQHLQVWLHQDFYNCECGPKNYLRSATELSTATGKMTKRVDNTTKKCGCMKGLEVSFLNPAAVTIHSHVDQEFVRISWDPDVVHVKACGETVTTAVSRKARMFLQTMIAHYDKETAADILDRWRKHVRNREMDIYGWTEDEFWMRVRQDKEYESNIDINIPVSTITSMKSKMEGTVWRFDNNEIKSLIRLIAERVGVFVLRFKPMELLDEAGLHGIIDMRPCAWCESSFETGKQLREHMESCECGQGTCWSAVEIDKYVQDEEWRFVNGNDDERAREKAEFCQEMVAVTDDWRRRVHSRNVKTRIESVVTPIAVRARTEREDRDDIPDEAAEFDEALHFLYLSHDRWKLQSLGTEVQIPASMRKKIDEALARRLDATEKLMTFACMNAPFNSAVVSNEKFQSLRRDAWLNDEVMNFVMDMHNLHSMKIAELEGNRVPSVRFVTSFFFHELERHGYDGDRGVARWKQTQHAWLLSDFIFFPVNVGGVHWISAIIAVKERAIVFVDSQNSSYYYNVVTRALRGWVMKDGAAKGINVGTEEDWKVVRKIFSEEQKQRGAFDCGMYVISIAREICVDPKLSLDQSVEFNIVESDMPRRRVALAFEIFKLSTAAKPHVDDFKFSTSEPKLQTELQRAVEEVRPTWRKFYADHGNVSKLPRVRIQQGRLEKQLVVVQPFVLVLATPRQLDLLWQFGHKRGVQLDSTFNITRSKFSTFTVIARHDHGFCMPLAFFIASDERQETISYALRVLRDKLGRRGDEYWCASAWMTDCSWAEHNAVKAIFPISAVLWCMYHVLDAIQRNITSKLQEKHGHDKHTLAISSKERGDVKRHFTRLCKEEYETNEAWYEDWNALLQYCSDKQREVDAEFGSSKYTIWESFRAYLARQWGCHEKLWAKHFRKPLTYGTQETTGSVESFHSWWKARIQRDGKGHIGGRRMDWLVHYLEHEVVRRYCDKVNLAETSTLSLHERKVRMTALRAARLIPDDDVTEAHNSTREEDEHDCFLVTFEGETHEVRGIESLMDCAMERRHDAISCSCKNGRNGKLCAPKVKVMLRTNETWTLQAINIRFRDEEDEPTQEQEPLKNDDVDTQRRRRLQADAYDELATKKIAIGEALHTLTHKFTLDQSFSCTTEQADHVLGVLRKLNLFLDNLDIHHALVANSSSKQLSSATRLPATGKANDTSLKRSKGWFERSQDEYRAKQRRERLELGSQPSTQEFVE